MTALEWENEILVTTSCKEFTHLGDCEHKIKLKIISETEDKLILCLG